MELTMPIVLVMREVLGLVETSTQARRILRTQSVTVNGKRVYDIDSAAGFMDVVSIDGKNYRILINQNNVLTVVPVPAGEEVVIQKIASKTSMAKGKTQLNCSSGRNLLAEKGEYKVGDSIVLSLDGKISGHYPLAVGASVLLTGGSHIGKIGQVEEVKGKTITISVAGEKFETAKTHAYVIGKGKPAITIQ
jgi:small subunit ribosomal protein S4e